MVKFQKFILLVGLFLTSLLFLGACGAAEPTATPVKEVAVEEPAAVEEPSSENQVPTIRREVPRISAEELKQRLDNGEAIVVADTRSLGSYKTRHIAGAISVPESEMEEHLDKLPKDQEIVLYCS